MAAYDFWEALSVRLPVRVMRILSGDNRDRSRARSIESWIHSRHVPIGLLRETEIVLDDDERTGSFPTLDADESLSWLFVDTSA